MRSVYAGALCQDDGATLDDVREAVTTLEDAERIARRVLGGAHPTTEHIERELRNARAALRFREAVTTLEDAERIARRVLGAAHPLTTGIEEQLQNVRAALRAHEPPSPAGSATAGIGGH